MAEALALIGIIASVAQLADYGLKIASLVSELHKKMRGASLMIQQRAVQIAQLIEIARSIEKIPELHTNPLASVLSECVLDAENIFKGLERLKSEPTDNDFRKWWRSIRGLTEERKILASFDQLEQKKTSLLLCIASIDNGIQQKIMREISAIRTQVDTVVEALPAGRYTDNTSKTETLLEYEEKKVACLVSLGASEQTPICSRILRESKSACGWFLESSSFTIWKSSHDVVFKVSGAPGFGKTTLAAHVIEHLGAIETDTLSTSLQGVRATAKPIILFFFFQRANQQTQGTATAALKALISQFIAQALEACPILMCKYDLLFAKGNYAWTWDDLWSVFCKMIGTILNGSQIFIVLDALDECEPRSAKELLICMNQLVESHHSEELGNDGVILKIFVTSRPVEQVGGSLWTFKGFEINEEDTVDDMQILINSSVRRFAVLNDVEPAVEQEIAHFLEVNARGVFLWVVLIMEALERRDKRLTKSTIAEKLSSIPKTFIDMYKATISELEPYRRDDFWRIVRWLVYAKRPLNVKEIETALSIEMGGDKWYGFTQDIKFLCGSFVRVESNRVQLIHQTARDFLLDLTTNPSLDSAGIDMDPHSVACHISHVCLVALTRDNPLAYFNESVIPSFHSDNYLEYQKRIGGYFNDTGFLPYATEYWSSHLPLPPIPPAVVQMTKELFSTQPLRDTMIRLAYYYKRHGSPFSPKGASKLHLAGYFGFPWLVSIYLEEGEDPNAISDADDPPLTWTAETGNDKCIQLLLDAGADPNKAEFDGWTALHWVAKNGHAKAAKLLLEAGANTCMMHEGGATAMDWAIYQNHIEVVDAIRQHTEFVPLIPLKAVQPETFQRRAKMVSQANYCHRHHECLDVERLRALSFARGLPVSGQSEEHTNPFPFLI